MKALLVIMFLVSNVILAWGVMLIITGNIPVGLFMVLAGIFCVFMNIRSRRLYNRRNIDA